MLLIAPVIKPDKPPAHVFVHSGGNPSQNPDEPAPELFPRSAHRTCRPLSSKRLVRDCFELFPLPFLHITRPRNSLSHEKPRANSGCYRAPSDRRGQPCVSLPANCPGTRACRHICRQTQRRKYCAPSARTCTATRGGCQQAVQDTARTQQTGKHAASGAD
jgi:hypothetical protein